MLSENPLIKSNYESCRVCSRRQMFRTYSVVCAKLVFAGTLFIPAIPTHGQSSFASARHLNPTATRFTTCSVVSICRDDAGTFIEPISPTGTPEMKNSPTRPDILFIMTDQQRFDTLAALGNSHIYTPNLDRLVRRGITFSIVYATCPVCVAARYTIRTGCEPPTTRVFSNAKPNPVAGQPAE